MEHPYQFEYISYFSQSIERDTINNLKQKLDNKNISNKNQKLSLYKCQNCLKIYSSSRNSCDCIIENPKNPISYKRKRNS